MLTAKAHIAPIGTRTFSIAAMLLSATMVVQAAPKSTPTAHQEPTKASRTPHGPIATSTPLPVAPETILAQSPIQEISSEVAWSAFEAQTVFLDARSPEVYAKGHVRGAWNLPIASATLDEHLVEFEVSVRPQPDTPLVVYCSGSGCPDSDHLATRLFQLGYRRILVYVDGFPDWVEKKRPVD